MAHVQPVWEEMQKTINATTVSPLPKEGEEDDAPGWVAVTRSRTLLPTQTIKIGTANPGEHVTKLNN